MTDPVLSASPARPAESRLPIWLLLGLLTNTTVIALAFLVAAVRSGSGQLFVATALTAVFAASVAASIVLLRRAQPFAAVYTVIAGLLLIEVGFTFLASGMVIILVAALLIIGIALTALLLPQSAISRMLSLISGGALVLALVDAWRASTDRLVLAPGLLTIISLGLLLSSLVAAGLLVRNFPRFDLRSKLLVGFVGLPVGALALLSAITNQLQPATAAGPSSGQNLSLLVTLVLAILIIPLANTVAGRLTAPLEQLTATAEAVRGGDLAVQAPITGDDEFGRLGLAFNQMTGQLRETLQGLEARVAQRTRALATTAQVSSRLTTILDPDELLREVVGELQTTFRYYHAHVYVLDPEQGRLTFKAGTGPAGAELLRRAHSIELGKGLVGQAAATHAPVLVADVTVTPTWLPNPLLPDTKSELAVPLVLGGEVLGVLDVQQNTVNALNDEDVQLLQSIAQQLAVALNNARSFAAMTAAQATTAEQGRTLATILDNLPVGVLVSDVKTGETSLVNKLGIELLGRSVDPARSPDEAVEPAQIYYPETETLIPTPELTIFQTVRDGQRHAADVDLVRDNIRMQLNTVSVPILNERGDMVSALALFRDISERRRNEREREQQLAVTAEQGRTLTAILDNLPVGVFVADTTGRPTLVNPAGVALLGRGVDPNRGADEYAEVYQTYLPESDTLLPTPELPLVQTLTDSQRHSADFDIVQGDGTRVNINAVAVPIKNEQGALVSALVLFRDISERKRNEREREQQLAVTAAQGRTLTAILDNLPVGVFVADSQTGLPTMVNKMAIEILGRGVDPKLQGGEYAEVYQAYQPDEDALMPNEELPLVQAMGGRESTTDLDIVRPDGSRVKISAVGVPIKDEQGAVVSGLALFSDVTARKAAEREREQLLAATAEQQRTLTAILDNLPVGVFVSDAKTGAPLVVNKMGVEILGRGIDPKQSADEYAEVYQVFRPGEQVLARPDDLPLSQALRGISSTADLDVERPDGSRINITKSGVPIYNEHGELVSALALFSDVTQRKAAEREREQLLVATAAQGRTLTAILDNLPVGVYVADSQTGLPTMVNKMAIEILGRGVDPKLQGGEYAEVYQAYRPNEDRLMPNEELPLVQAMGGRESIADLDIVRPDGSRVNINAIGVPIKDEQGALVSGLALFSDVTARKAAEREREQLLAATAAQGRTLVAILDNLPVGVFVANSHTGLPVLVNKMAIEILGRGVDPKLQGGEYAEVYQAYQPDEDALMPNEELPLVQAIGGRESTADLDIVRPDGSRVKISAVGVPIKDERGLVVSGLALFSDVTARKNAEREREQLLLQLAKRAVELETVSQVSADASQVLEVEQLLQTVVDLTKDRFALYHAHVYLFDPATATLVLRAGSGEVGRQMVAEGRSIPLSREQSLVARAARTRRPVVINDVTSTPSFLPHRLLPNTRSELAVPLVVGTTVLGVLDVQDTRIDHFTPEEERIYAILASQIAVAVQNANLYAQQVIVVQQLRDVDQLKSSFLANMSHELRTPLNSILGFTEVMLEGINGPLNEFMENDLKIIYRNGSHLLQLINDILDMAKIESGTLRLNPEPVDIHEALSEVVTTAQPLARQKSLALSYATPTTSPLVIEADRARLRQVLLNLVSNAVKFTDEGSITLSAHQDQQFVELRVRDTGLGVPLAQQTSIFQEFHQVDNSMTRKVGGTGLGLAISRHLIEMHGGTLTVESSGVAGEGSTFVVTLPVTVPAALAADPDSAAPALTTEQPA